MPKKWITCSVLHFLLTFPARHLRQPLPDKLGPGAQLRPHPWDQIPDWPRYQPSNNAQQFLPLDIVVCCFSESAKVLIIMKTLLSHFCHYCNFNHIYGFLLSLVLMIGYDWSAKTKSWFNCRCQQLSLRQLKIQECDQNIWPLSMSLPQNLRANYGTGQILLGGFFRQGGRPWAELFLNGIWIWPYLLRFLNQIRK